MKFGIVQTDRFNALGGSYSIVTDRELYDSQITATDAEVLLLESYFRSRGETIYRGNVASNREAAKKTFRLYPSGKRIALNLVYPKLLRTELRLYLSSRAGFMPRRGDVWFLFVSRQNELWIGAMPEREWRQENSSYREGEAAEFDPPESEHEKKTKRQNRSKELVDRRLKLSKYKCEFDPSHKLFIARATGCPYLEVHHIIPNGLQRHYKRNLDSLDNLCCLCPYCHSVVHHASEEMAREVLTRIAELRATEFHFKVSNEELFRLYSVEEITR